MYPKILYSFLALALTSLACGLAFEVPTKEPGPDVTDEISVAGPDSKTAYLTLEFGAGKLTLAPGAEGKLVSGTATYNVPDLQPEVIQKDDNITIKQGDYTVNGIPNMEGLKNDWDLKLGNTDLDLTLQAGAYDGALDLGGLSLVNLTVNDGAADVTVDFSAANPTEMNALTYKTGASNIKLLNLANANFSSLVFEGGIGNYTLDFNGELQRDAAANIRAGMSNITLVIPTGISAQVTVEDGLSSVDTPSGWKKNGNTYTQEGEGPTLTIIINVGAGNLQITQ